MTGVRPLVEALAAERGRVRLSGRFIAMVRMLSDETLGRAEYDLWECLVFGPYRYPEADWKTTAEIYALVVEERAFRGCWCGDSH